MRRLAAAVLVLLAGSGCVEDAPERPAPAPTTEAAAAAHVAATVAPHAWLVAEIVGDDAEVVTVLPPSADPHTHLPTDAEASRLARASLLFRSGVPFENGAWFGALTSRGVVSVDLRSGVGSLGDAHDDGRHALGSHDLGKHDHGNHDHGSDPHTWLSPRRLVIQARTVEAALTETFPDRADDFARRSAALVARLQALDAELAQRLAPYRGRTFLVLHPSWSYFADDYGLRQMAIEAGGSAPSDAEITELLRRARDAGIRTVFVQPQSAQRLPAAIAEALGVGVETLDPLTPEVPANLRRVADRLIVSWENSEGARP